MATLTGQSIANSYKDLLQVSNSNNGIDATSRLVSDGEGTNSILYLSTGKVGVGKTPDTKFAVNLDTNKNLNFSASYMGSIAGILARNDGNDSMADLGLAGSTIQFSLDGTNDAMKLDSTGLLLIGANGTVSGAPDGDGNEFVIRNNADAGMSILAGESSGHTSSIIFGSASDLNGANIFYEYHTKTMKLGTQHSSGILTLRSGNGTNAVSIDASQNATFNADVKISKASGSTTQSFVPATGQSSQIKFMQDDGSTQDSRIFSPEGAQDLAFEAGTTEVLRLDTNSRISLSNNDGGGSGGDSSTTGNTLLGHLIGDMDTNSINNTLIGHKVAGGGTHADMRSNVGVGTLALYAITEGDNNIAIGKESADAITTGSANVAIGTSSLGANTATHNNTAVGTSVLQSLEASSQNTAVGSSAMSSIGTGASGLNNCVAIGYQAFQGGVNTTSGPSGTVAIGMNSLQDLTTGVSNTAIGYESQLQITDSQRNTSVGYQSLKTASTGDSNNTAIGYASLEISTTGGNTAVGSSSSQFIDTGENNTALGYGAMTSSGSGNDASLNVAVGYLAFNGSTDGDQNTIIGASANPSAGTGSNQTVIGYNATGIADNSVTLGNSSVTEIAIPNASMIRSQATQSFADDATLTIMASQAGGAMVYVYDSTSGGGGAFFVTYMDGAVKVAGSSNVANSDSDGSLCVFKSTSSHGVTIKNRLGATRSIAITVMSALSS